MAGRLFDAIFKHPTSAHVKKLAEGNLEFALNLYETICQQNEGDNVFFSPFSITVALGMTYVGARNNSSKEVRKTAKFDSFENDDDLHAAFNCVLQSLISKSEDVSQPYMLNVVNGLYIQESYDILEDFLTILQKQFMSETHKVDFIKDLHNVVKDINEWVAVATNQKIRNLISQGVINSLTRLVLINAIYFKGNWKDKFNPQITSKGEFHRNASDVIQVEFMRSKRNYAFAYNEQLKCKMIELPYADKRLVMQVILPDETDGLTPLVKQLSTEIFRKLRAALQPTPDVEVKFPKFKLEIGLNLNQIFHDLGIQELFIPGKADLTGISPKGDLCVSHVIHKAFVDVNESGTEAAAATAVANRYRRSIAIQDRHEFIADHPFFFVIYDKYFDMNLFMGRLSNPPTTAS